MAAQPVALDTTHLQSHTTTAAHRGVALFLFLRFLSKAEKENRKHFEVPALDGSTDAGPGNAQDLIDFVLSTNASDETRKARGRREIKAPVEDRAGRIAQMVDAVAAGKARSFSDVKPALAPLSWRSTLA